MKNFVKLSKDEMKMVLGGLHELTIESHQCDNGTTQYTCTGMSVIDCIDDCISQYGGNCGCS